LHVFVPDLCRESVSEARRRASGKGDDGFIAGAWRRKAGRASPSGTTACATGCEDAPVRRTLANGLELDDDAARVDLDAVHDFLANHSYWAEGRPREVVERLLWSADRVVGLYDGHRQVGFARAFTDGETLAYLADVYVLPAYRRRGLGVELVREMVEAGPYAHLRWLLHTRDAHDLYRRFGFTAPSERLLERPRP
jgi:GNAT superfamily N-acetyltransferase